MKIIKNHENCENHKNHENANPYKRNGSDDSQGAMGYCSALGNPHFSYCAVPLSHARQK